MPSFADVLTGKHKIPAKMSLNAPKPPIWNVLALLSSIIWPKKVKPVEMKPAAPNDLAFVPESKFFEEKITQEVLSFADNSHRPSLQLAADAFRRFMSENFPEYSVWLTGSFPAGVDLAGSDLDFTLEVENKNNRYEGDILKSLKEKMKEIRRVEFEGDRCPHREFGYFWVVFARVPVLQMVHLATGVSIDVTLNNDAPKRNTQLLVYYGQIDSRFPILCRAIKRWATHNGVQGAKDGRLNSFSLCLMVIYFLQTRANILPNLQELFPELNGEFKVRDDCYGRRNLREEMEKRGIKIPGDSNDVGVGVLFVAFIKYFSKFDFYNRWISVRLAKPMKKRRHNDGYALDGMPESSRYICIEDPFLLKTPWNCAGSVWHYETYKRLRMEFQLSYHRILEERTIFTNGQVSEWRRRIDGRGKERDLQTLIWRGEIERREMKKNGEHWVRMVHLFGKYDPRRYWDQDQEQKIAVKKEKKESVPWPVMERILPPF